MLAGESVCVEAMGIGRENRVGEGRKERRKRYRFFIYLLYLIISWIKINYKINYINQSFCFINIIILYKFF